MAGNDRSETAVVTPRPWCCPEPRCAPVHQLSDNPDLSVPSSGDSFSCWGSLGEEVGFVYDGVDHANDLRSCHYTPLKGLVMWQENRDDWRLLRDAYGEALRKVTTGGPATFDKARKLLGQKVRVTLGEEDGSPVIAEGRLLRISDDGEVAVQDDTFAVHYCWPMLHIEVADA